MAPSAVARLFAGRVHYAWIVLGLMFLVMLSTAGVRAAPSVLIVPLQNAFGWDRATISAALSLNIGIYGLIGPFAAALMQTIGLKRTILLALVILSIAVALSGLIDAKWQLFLTWGALVGLGAGATAGGLAATVANRWFVKNRGLAVGILTASNASGQLIFLPVLAAVAESDGWRMVSWVVAGFAAVMIPLVLLLLPESPRSIGLGPLGAEVEPPAPPRGNAVAMALGGLARGARSGDFWLLAGSFWICGFSANGLVGTHLISYCIDNGIAPVAAASVVAGMGVFDLIGTTCSGWLSDRYNPRILLFWYYGLRGLSLILLPFSSFDAVSLSAFSVFYGLDFVATVPPTVILTNQIFGRQSAPIIVAWLICGHQIGAATAAAGAGWIRNVTGSYFEAFIISGAACMLASLIVLRISKPSPAAAVPA
ncbi:MAG: MFS transporter [Proteobacteria bacterium]|nr:MFS transporter [Pseudomonadota bacterium]